MTTIQDPPDRKISTMNLPVNEIKTLLSGLATNLCNAIESGDREKALAAQKPLRRRLPHFGIRSKGAKSIEKSNPSYDWLQVGPFMNYRNKSLIQLMTKRSSAN